MIQEPENEPIKIYDFLDKKLDNLFPEWLIPYSDGRINTMFEALDIKVKEREDGQQVIVNTIKEKEVILPNSEPSTNEYYGNYVREPLSTSKYDHRFSNNNQLSFVKLFEIPMNRITSSPDAFSLFEKIIMNTSMMKNMIDINNYKSHKLIGNTWDEIFDNLRKNLPMIDEAIQRFLEMDISKLIMNLREFSILFSKYNIQFHQLHKELRNKIYTKIHENNLNYIKIQKKNKVLIQSKPLTLRKSQLTNEKKVNLAKEYIFSKFTQTEQNSLLKRFIDIFTRKPMNENEDNLWLYNIYNDKKILCTHYEYLIKSTNDNDIFHTMIEFYGAEPEDGCISCKNCGEFLCLEEFSNLSGFKDNIPLSQTAVMFEDNNYEEILHDPINDSLIELFELLSSLLSVNPNDKMLYEMIQTYLHVDSKTLSVKRYDETDITTKPVHPRIKKEIAEINKEIKTKKNLRKKI